MEETPKKVTTDQAIVGDQSKASKRSSLINRSAVKHFALDYCGRSTKLHVRKNMKHISGQVYEDLEIKIREWIRTRIDGQPSKGKTVM